MKISEIIKGGEDVGGSMQDPKAKAWVVIGNRGKGQQTTWPNAKEPGLYTKDEADKIAKERNDSKTMFNQGPGGGTHFHVKHITDALESVSSGNACYNSLRQILDDFNNAGGYDDHDQH